MNNEELAKSLRTEMNTYLKNTVADLQQEIAGMQERILANIEQQRADLEKTFGEMLAKGSATNVDADFARLINEHLTIAYEDGAKESQDKAEAEIAQMNDAQQKTDTERNAEIARLAAEITKREAETGNAGDFTVMRDAVSDISAQTSQAEVLRALVKHASDFAPRGAFFIVKSDHLVGWRIFGSEMKDADESAVREVFLAMNGDTLLGNSISENQTQRALEGGRDADAQYLKKLNFGEPSQMIAIPLVVRNRGVAVLYADSGANAARIQTEGLETLVRVASMTVEMLAAAKSAPSNGTPRTAPKPQTKAVAAKEVAFAAPVETAREIPVTNFDFNAPEPADKDSAVAFDQKSFVDNVTPVEKADAANSATAFDSFTFNKPSAAPEEAKSSEFQFENFAPKVIEEKPARQSETSFSFETAAPAANNFAPLPVEVVEETTETAQAPAARRFGERNMELPIDVPDDERRLHNDARRFARLLVSEIKLYNEQKVKEGRQAGDLYSRLREAVDRSREMYDKRVSPPVAARFDYFHYEIVNTLAEGDDARLGGDYPGASV